MPSQAEPRMVELLVSCGVVGVRLLFCRDAKKSVNLAKKFNLCPIIEPTLGLRAQTVGPFRTCVVDHSVRILRERMRYRSSKADWSSSRLYGPVWTISNAEMNGATRLPVVFTARKTKES
jgi:hypothetical protein